MGLAVGFVGRAVVLERTLTHDALADDQAGFALHRLSLVERLANLCGVVADNFDDFPTESAILGSSVLAHNVLGLSGELDVVGVVEHDQVVQTQNAGDTRCALRNLLLDTAVGDVGVDGLLGEGGVAGVSSQELGGNGGTDGKHVTLTQRAGSVLHTALNLKLGMARSGRAPLTQLLQLLKAVLADEAKLRVEHGSHVTGIEEETVAAHPTGILRIVFQIFTVENIDEVCAAHSATGVAALGFLYGRSSEDTDVIRCVIKNFDIVHLLFVLCDYFLHSTAFCSAGRQAL